MLRARAPLGASVLHKETPAGWTAYFWLSSGLVWWFGQLLTTLGLEVMRFSLLYFINRMRFPLGHAALLKRQLTYAKLSGEAVDHTHE